MAFFGPIFELILRLFVVKLFIENVHGVKDKHHWNDVGRSEVFTSLLYKWNTNTAKNVIIFVGDGMSPEVIAASRIYYGDGENSLAWEKFPHIGFLKTHHPNKQITDSASTATALFCGVKTNHKVAGVDANVRRYDCEASLQEEYRVDSIFAWAQAAGKDTGFVTTTRITGATSSALYAHTADRAWECEELMPKSAAKCKDIAKQLIQDQPGKDIKVIMGGGRQMLQSDATAKDGDPIDHSICYSRDGRDLIEDWTVDKTSRGYSYAEVQNNEELSQVNPEEVDFLLGVFANSHMSRDWERNTGPEGQPSLENMTTTAIKILQKSEKGFLLVVEGGLIDVAHSRETVRFSEAIQAALNQVDTNQTLVIVTSNHDPSMPFRDVSETGENILGLTENSQCDSIPDTIFGCSTGAPNNMVDEEDNASIPVREHPSEEEEAAVITDDLGYSEVDVAVYALGPYAHLFHTIHEQNFVAHAIAYSAHMGEYYSSQGSSSTACFLILLMVVLPFLG